jgi:FHA domain
MRAGMRARIPPVQSKEEQKVATLRLVPASGSPIEISQDQALLGRDPTCDFVLNDGSVSRRHARVEKRGTGWAVVDQGSANGTFLDSHRVSDAALRDGQDLRFGSVTYKVEIEGEGDTGATLSGVAPDATVVQAIAAVAPPPPPPRPAAPVPPPPPPRPAGPSTPAAPSSLPSPPPPPPPPRPPVTATLPSPVPAMDAGAPPPPPRKGKGPVFWAATGCVGCLTLVVLFVALIGGGFYFSMRGPSDAVKGELSDIRKGQIDDAYARLSEGYKARLTREDFERGIAAHPALRETSEGHFWSWSVHVVNDKGRVTGKIGSPPTQEDATFGLTKEAGAWKISSIAVGGSDLFGDTAPDEPPSESP